jgi:hypothetical protein
MFWLSENIKRKQVCLILCLEAKSLFEYVWKFLKTAGEYQGSEIPGPRPAILEAARYGWIKDREIWAGFLEARNAGIHDYFGLSSEEYAGIARNYYAAAVDSIKRIQKELLSEKK